MEWTKVLRNKKLICILVGLLLLQLLLFLYMEQRADEEAVLWADAVVMVNGVAVDRGEDESEESMSYPEEYRQTIASIVEQADAMSSISIFSQANSFSSRNLARTKADYTRILDVAPVEFDGEFLERFFGDGPLGVFLILCGLVIAFGLVDENRIGLRCMIFSSRGGRARLTLRKILALLLWDAIIVIVLCGTTLVACLAKWGGNLFGCLGYPAQSLETFELFPQTWSIGGLLAAYLLYRLITLFILTIIAWCILSCIDHLLLSGGLIAIIAIVSYLLGKIGANHPLSALRYCSPWSLLADASFFSEYRNLNILGRAVNKKLVIICVWAIIATAFVVIAFLVGTKRYPCRSAGRIRILGKAAGKILRLPKRAYAAFLEHLPLTGAEYYKTLIPQCGVIAVAVLVIVLIWQTDFGTVMRTGSQDMYYDFLESYSGMPSEESDAYITDLGDELAEVEADYFDASEKYAAGEIDSQEYMVSYLRYEAYDSDRQFYLRITEQTEYLKSLEGRGISGWYINTYTYSALLNEGDSLINLLLILCVVLLCSGVFAREKQCGIAQVMRSSALGREAVFGKKMGMAMILSAALFLFSEGLTLASVIHAYGTSSLIAPVQSLMMLEFVPFKCSIGAFMAILYVLRILVLLAVAAVACTASAAVSQRAAIVISLVLCVPSALSIVGIPFMQYFSIISVLSLTPFLLMVKSVWIAFSVCAVFIAIGVFAIVAGYRSWCGVRKIPLRPGTVRQGRQGELRK
ncbi:MAG: hypothetical protein LUI02_04315 [Clostridiales bacterium]|nr:hypothetical protein [Clostridiales bacterium]